jgi:hypothetical protein
MSLLPRTPIMRRSFIARTDHRRMGPAISGCRPGVAIAGESGAGGAGGNSPGSAAAHGAPASPTPTTTSVHTPAWSECFIEFLPGVCCPITPAVYHPVQRHEVVERTQPFVPRAWLREFLSRRRSPRDEVVDVTMNGEDDASHLPVRVFRKLQVWRRPRRDQRCPGSIRKGYSPPISGGV